MDVARWAAFCTDRPHQDKMAAYNIRQPVDHNAPQRDLFAMHPHPGPETRRQHLPSFRHYYPRTSGLDLPSRCCRKDFKSVSWTCRREADTFVFSLNMYCATDGTSMVALAPEPS